MGGGLARNLIKAGKEVLIFDLSAEAVQKTIEAGKTGKAVKEIKEMAGADVVFTSLPLPTDVEGVMLGEKGLLGLMKPGSTYIDVSTIDPKTARRLSEAAEARKIHFLECAMANPSATPSRVPTATRSVEPSRWAT